MNISQLILYATILSTPQLDAVHPKAILPDQQFSPSALPQKEKELAAEEKPVVTRHEISVNGRALKYIATAGTMPIANTGGEIEARLFYTAYTAENSGNIADRPLIFAFNGGPGSSSVWLHLGTIGPKRVSLQDDGSMPPPPYKLIDNSETWLDQADLVFIDPVGTGFSRAVKPDQASKFFSLKGDIDSVGEFIRLYLTRHERWSSPLFLVGESYGSTRAAGLAGNLFERGIAFNGIILISTILNFSTIGFMPGNDLPYVLFLPSYTATAWFHKKLAPELTGDLPRTLGEVEKWATTEYSTALAKGESLSLVDRQEIIKKISRYTGLSERYIDINNLRIEPLHFSKELLRDKKLMVGRFDGRIQGIDLFPAAEDPAFDPSLTAIRPPFSASFNNYIRTELGYKSDLEYYILGGGIGRWDWGANNNFVDTSESLRSTITKNPYMKVFVASGNFDLATPYLGTEYTLNHMELDPSLRRNITTARYDAGHMMYTDKRTRVHLKEDVSKFIRDALSYR